MEIHYINGVPFAEYNKDYYISQTGDVYSVRSNIFLKHAIDMYGYHRVDIYGKHHRIHKLVWNAWNGDVPEGLQINHLDDNKENNALSNLYIGTQKENIADCIRNGHRKGHLKPVTIIDAQEDTIKTYNSCKDFIETTGHSCVSGSFAKIRKTNWFKERYGVLFI